MTRWLLPAALLLCAPVIAPACKTSQMRDSMKALEESIEGYHEAYRWKNYERAAAYVPADLRAAYLATYEDEDVSLHIEDYQILRVDMQSEEAALVTVRLRYMQLPSVTVEKATLVQHWHKIQGVWTMESEENSIRQLSIDKKPRNPEAFGGDAPSAEQEGETQVEVESPTGEVLRKDKAPESKEPEPEPGEAESSEP